MSPWLADLVALVHLAYVAFVVLGEAAILLGWRLGWAWTRGRLFRLLHLAAIGLVVVESWLGLWCPLTRLEERLRGLAPSDGRDTGFLGDWVARLLYYEAPPWGSSPWATPCSRPWWSRP